jgi:predicted CXXCH cytochrome family protein
VAGVPLGLLFLLSACSSLDGTVASPPHIAGATFVGNQACLECHTNLVQSFPSSPHGRYHRDHDLRMAGETGCESCHGAGSLHVQAGGGRDSLIYNPGLDPAPCFQCHLEVHAEFRLPQRHPVIEGKMNCVQCHDPHGSDLMKPAGGLAMARLNESCAGCHREQARPFVFEHEALREGCTACHQPHGSVNSALLVQRDANLCLKCHAQVSADAGALLIGKVDHSSFLRLGGCWSAGCHTAVHGSNINPKLLY